jgi:hypothetical protein
MEQLEGFQLSENAYYVYKLKSCMVLEHGTLDWINNNSRQQPLHEVTQDSILLIEVYVDDIIFGSNDDRLRQKFAKDMHNEFEILLLGELSFFLGLQIRQRNQDIFIYQTKYIIVTHDFGHHDGVLVMVYSGSS